MNDPNLTVVINCCDELASGREVPGVNTQALFASISSYLKKYQQIQDIICVPDGR